MMEGKQNREDEDNDQCEDLQSSKVHRTDGSSSLSPRSEINRARLPSNFIFVAPLPSSRAADLLPQTNGIEPHHSMRVAARSKHR
jgi:hypothetical protein